jgi:hypothetical protein
MEHERQGMPNANLTQGKLNNPPLPPSPTPPAHRISRRLRWRLQRQYLGFQRHYRPHLFMCHYRVDVEEISIARLINIHAKYSECFPSAINICFCRHHIFGTDEIMSVVKRELSDRSWMYKPAICWGTIQKFLYLTFQCLSHAIR